MGLPVVINYGIGDTEAIVESNNIGVVIRDFTEQCYNDAIDKLMQLLQDKQVRFRCRKIAEEQFSLESGVW